MDQGHLWAAAGGAVVAMVLGKVLPGGPQGLLELFCALLVAATVLFCAVHLARVIERAIGRLEQRHQGPSSGGNPPPQHHPQPTRHIDAP